MMDRQKLEEAKEALTKLEINFVSIGENRVAEALSTTICCIDRVTELEKENAELIHRVDALDLLLDWAIECDFDFDSLGDTYDEFKAEVLDIYGFKESMIKIAECYIEKYGDERWH